MLYPNPKTDERWPAVIQNGIAYGVRHNKWILFKKTM